MAIYTGRAEGETYLGTTGSDTIYGLGGDDLLKGGDGKDTVEGGTGNDEIWGDAGDDKIYGGDGDDRIRGGVGSDFVDGGDGKDEMVFRDIGNHGLVVDTAIGKAYFKTQVDTFVNMEVMEGSNYNDTMYGGAGDDSFVGKNGDDSLFGGDGNDFIEGKWDQDLIEGGAGVDRLYGGLGNDVMSGGTGADQMFGGEHRDVMWGGKDGDKVSGDAGNDTLSGGHGNDGLYGGLHSDVFRYYADEMVTTDAPGHDSGRDVIFDFTRKIDPTTKDEDEVDLYVRASNGAERHGFAAFDTNHNGVIGAGDEAVSVVSYTANGVTKDSLQIDMGALVKALGGTTAYLAKAGAHLLIVHGVTELNADDVFSGPV